MYDEELNNDLHESLKEMVANLKAKNSRNENSKRDGSSKSKPRGTGNIDEKINKYVNEKMSRFQTGNAGAIPKQKKRVKETLPRCDSRTSLGGDSTSSLASHKSKNNDQYLPAHCIRSGVEFPFYYHVPENPARVNHLPPGIYLVIPQNRASVYPLKVFEHPESDEEEQKGRGRSRRRPSPHHLSHNSSIETHRQKDSPKNSKTTGNRQNERSKTNTSSNTEDEEKKALMDELLSKYPFLKDDIPRNDTEKREPQSVTEKIHDLMISVNLKAAETKLKLLEGLPNMSPAMAEKKAAELMCRKEDIEDFIREQRRQMQIDNDVEAIIMYDPEADPVAIRRFCEEFEGENLLLAYTAMKEVQLREIEEQEKMAQIYSILPNADPAFVESQVKKFEGDGNALNQMLFELLENDNYPKIKEKDSKTKEFEKLWKYYVIEFNITNYLDKVPEPESVFLDKNYTSPVSRQVAIQFLEDRYRTLDSYQLNHLFESTGGNLSRICNKIDKNYLSKVITDMDVLKGNVEEPFLQELAFINNREEITRYLNEKKELKETEIALAKLENSFLKCDCCFDEELVASDVVTCPEGHIFCKSCLSRFIEVSFGAGMCRFACLHESCEEEYTMKVLEASLKQSLYSRIMQKRVAEEIDKAAMPDLEKCPSCEYCYIPSPDDKIFKCENVDCLRETCRLCKEPSHIPLTCKEVERPKDLEARKRIEEAMSMKLMRCCPNCSRKFIKIDGCNKISCICGTLSCYLCGQVVQGYSHFNGQGGTNFDRCPLYSDNHVLHVLDVQKAGEEMKHKTLKDDPDIHLVVDPTQKTP